MINTTHDKKFDIKHKKYSIKNKKYGIKHKKYDIKHKKYGMCKPEKTYEAWSIWDGLSGHCSELGQLLIKQKHFITVNHFTVLHTMLYSVLILNIALYTVQNTFYCTLNSKQWRLFCTVHCTLNILLYT